jgi:hypothetical protein
VDAEATLAMTTRLDDLDKQWYDWCSAVGMGVFALCSGLALTAVLAAISLLA